jgi:dephospho-CoA kinase
MKKKVLIGLTGGLAGGKSTVAKLFREAGFLVVDADRLVAELYLPGAKGTAKMVELFGPGILGPDQGVDKNALAAKIFSDAAQRKEVEAAIHPLVRERFREIAEKAEGVAVYEATLLVESGHAKDFDFVVTVEAPAELRLKRAVERGMSEEQARARLLAQGDGAVRLDGAHRVIDNSGDLEHLKQEVDSLIAELRGICGELEVHPLHQPE